MAPISRGFRRRHPDDGEPGRLPPGQYLERGFPVLSAGPTPRPDLSSWSFAIGGEIDERRSWTWDEFQALPHETVTKDIHCVTKWSKFDTTWEGVSLDVPSGDVLAREFQRFLRQRGNEPPPPR